MHAHATALDRRQPADLPQRNQTAPAEQRDFTELLSTLIRRDRTDAAAEADHAAGQPFGRARGHYDDGSRGRGPERRRNVLPEQAAFDTPPGRLDKDLRPHPVHHARPARPDRACDHHCAPVEAPAAAEDTATPAAPQAQENSAEQSGAPAAAPPAENTEANETGMAIPEPAGQSVAQPAIALLPETRPGAGCCPAQVQPPAVVANTAEAGAGRAGTELTPAAVGAAAALQDSALAAGTPADDLVALTHATAPSAPAAKPHASNAAHAPAPTPAIGTEPLLTAPMQEIAAARPEPPSPRDPAAPSHTQTPVAADVQVVAGPADGLSGKPANVANNDQSLERLMVTNAVAGGQDRAAVEAKPEAVERKDPSDAKLMPIAATAHRVAEQQGPSENAVARNPGSVPTQVAQPIIRAVRNGTDRIEIHLTPAELGRVDVKLDIAPDGRVQAVFAVDRPQTADLLQRDARELARALQDAGLRADMGSLSFNLRNQNQGQPQTWMANFGDGRAFAPERAEIERAAFYRPMIVNDDQVDLHV